MTSQEKVEMRSIIDNHWRCFICKSERNLELHHCLHGSYRTLADKDGLFVALCMNCHTNLHDKGKYDKELQRIAQAVYMNEHKCTREDFLKRYGRCFD